MKKILAVFAVFWLASMNSGVAEEHSADQTNHAWSLAFGGIYLHRTAGSNTVMLQDAAFPTANLSTDKFDDLGALGGVVSLSGYVSDFGFDVRGVFTAPASGNGTLAFAAPTLVRINSVVPFFLPGVTQITGTRETTFNSIEANLHLLSGNHWRVFGGVRAIWIDDDMNLSLASAALPTTITQTTSNRLVGPQLGVELTLPEILVPKLQLSASARVALLRNRMAFNNVLNTGVVIVTAAGQDSNWRPMIEFGANAILNVTPKLDVQIGYNLVYFDEVTSSPAAIVGANYFTSTFVGGTESALYHGATLKAVLRLN